MDLVKAGATPQVAAAPSSFSQYATHHHARSCSCQREGERERRCPAAAGGVLSQPPEHGRVLQACSTPKQGRVSTEASGVLTVRELLLRWFTGANPAAAATAPVDLLKYAIKVREVSIELEAG
jgi:hypothetical protein